MLRSIINNIVKSAHSNDAESLVDQDAKRSSRVERRIERITQQTGWSTDQARAHYVRAIDDGISGYYYMKCRGWEFGDDFDALAEAASELKQKRDLQKAKRAERIEKISLRAKVSPEEAERMLDEAEEFGIPGSYYIICKGWEYGNDLDRLKIDAENVRIERKKQEEREISDIASASGRSRDVCRQLRDKARSKGLLIRSYIKYHGWDLNDDELDDLVEVLRMSRAQRERDRDFYAQIVAERAGLTIEEAKKKMDEAKHLGFSYMRYAQKDLWNLTEDQVEEAARNIVYRAQTTRLQQERIIPEIASLASWSLGKTLLEIQRSRMSYGASATDFYQCRFWEMPFERQSEYLTWGLMQKFRIAATSYTVAHEAFDDKPGFNRRFSDVIPRKWFVVDESTTFDQYKRGIEGLEQVIVKPVSASCGVGVHKINCNRSIEDDWSQFELLRNQEGATIVEQVIVQHAALNAIAPNSVNTIRIVTLNYFGTCRRLMAALRMGTGADVDNFHCGGIAAEVDVETGIVLTNACDFDGKEVAEHPVSKVTLKGLHIPHWNEVIDTCERIFDRVPGASLIGWDFAITPDGVEIIEGNAGSAYDLLQVPHQRTFGSGLRSQVIDPYFDPNIPVSLI